MGQELFYSVRNGIKRSPLLFGTALYSSKIGAMGVFSFRLFAAAHLHVTAHSKLYRYGLLDGIIGLLFTAYCQIGFQLETGFGLSDFQFASALFGLHIRPCFIGPEYFCPDILF